MKIEELNTEIIKSQKKLFEKNLKHWNEPSHTEPREKVQRFRRAFMDLANLKDKKINEQLVQILAGLKDEIASLANMTYEDLALIELQSAMNDLSEISKELEERIEKGGR